MPCPTEALSALPLCSQPHTLSAGRYIVLPVRPQGTEGWTEEQLLPLVSRDSLLGVKIPGVQVPRGNA